MNLQIKSKEVSFDEFIKRIPENQRYFTYLKANHFMKGLAYLSTKNASFTVLFGPSCYYMSIIDVLDRNPLVQLECFTTI